MAIKFKIESLCKTTRKSIVFLFTLITIQLTSCHQSALSSSTFQKNKMIEQDTTSLTFEILNREDDKIRTMEYESYRDYQMLATIKKINVSDQMMVVDEPMYFFDENFEINNLQGKSVDSLFAYYHYQILLDPATNEPYGDKIQLKPNEFMLDTINLNKEFRFNILDAPDTFLIRFKEYPYKKRNYSNWDTLVIK